VTRRFTRVRSVLIAIASLLMLPSAAHARAGDFDKRFSGDGRVSYAFDRDEVVPVAIAPDARGGLYVLASTPGREWVVAHVSTRGGLDPRFGQLGGFTLLRNPGADGNAHPKTIAVQRRADGSERILVGGQTTGAIAALCALDRRGHLDRTFGVRGRFVYDTDALAYPAAPIVVAADGRITWVVGYAPWKAPQRSGARVWDLGVDARIPAPRATDLDLGGWLQDAVQTPGGALRMTVQTDRGLLLAGLAPDRTPDTTLGPDGRRVLDAEATTYTYDTIIAGDRVWRTTERYPHSGFVLHRDDLAGGHLRTTVGGRRIGTPEAIAADPVGRIYVYNVRRDVSSRPFRASIVRFRADGAVDRTFGRLGVMALPSTEERPLLYGELTVDSAHNRLWLAADRGDGMSTIRDDFGKDRVYVAAIRLR